MKKEGKMESWHYSFLVAVQVAADVGRMEPMRFELPASPEHGEVSQAYLAACKINPHVVGVRYVSERGVVERHFLQVEFGELDPNPPEGLWRHARAISAQRGG